ncbi:MAG: transposase [Anaerolineaceae bacterium]|nr:transposase [Anaerolineaceae bacterium]
MPNTPRLKSASNIYHVMIRGNNKQTIFKDNEDYQKFLSTLFEHQKQKHIYLYAWCLMPNHIYLLLKEKEVPLSYTFQSTLTRFVLWYNFKYKRVGHLFQGRYKTRPVEDPTYFLRVIRYIHRNPLDSNLCTRLEDYPYSSFTYIFRSEKYKEDQPIYNLMLKKDFEEYHHEKDNDQDFLNIRSFERFSDEEVIELILNTGLVKTAAEVKSLPREERTEVIQLLLREGVSYRRINLLTGTSLSIIRVVSKEYHKEEALGAG